MYLLRIYDEIITQQRPTYAFSLDFATATTTAKDVLKQRIRQDCERINLEKNKDFQAKLAQITADKKSQLSQLTEQEVVLNGEKAGNFFRIGIEKQSNLDWQIEFDKAVKAFSENGFLLFIDDEQIMDLEQKVEIKADNTSKMTFIRLIPLQGG